MTKHLYFNPKDFDQLVLSGVLIQLLKSDVEVHSHDEAETVKFVQGENVVEGNIQNILRFVNAISKNKIFGRNWQQQAVINMINGVCKDIEKKLPACVQSSQLTDKIEFLNQYWFNKSNEWLLKRGFLACHMQILTLSFLIQEKFPEILIKYQCFVELRKLFIEEKLLSKPSLIAMFTHPQNKYQEYDLFPELEQSVNDVRRSMGSQYGDEFPHENNHQPLIEIETGVSYIQSSEKQPSKLEPENIVISKLKEHQSAVVANIPSQILEEIPYTSEIQTKQQEEKHHHHQNEQESKDAQALTHELVVVQEKTAQASQQKVLQTENISLQQHVQENFPQAPAQQSVENKPPRQQSHRGSIKGPKSAMNTKIRAKQQSVVVHKQTCKCEIF